MTKAERIFNDTRWECKELIEARGYAENPNGKAVGICGLIIGDDEHTSTRTHNAIQKIIDSKRADLNIDVKLDIISNSRFELETKILNMVQSTLDNEINRYKIS